MISIIADPSFEFPSPTWYADMANGMVVSHAEAQQNLVSCAGMTEAYKSLFQSLCLRFSPHGSAFMQDAEVQEMAPRFRTLLAKRTSLAQAGIAGTTDLDMF